MSRLSWKVKAGVALIALTAGLLLFLDGPVSTAELPVYRVTRGPLQIRVLEGGTVEARESQEIKSEVRGQTKILSIVEEGYLVTEEDIENGKVLVVLDDSEVVQRLTQAEMEYQNTYAALEDAIQQYDIQVKQNESDIKAAELEMKFARMDFEKYLGSALAADLLAGLELDDIEVLIARDAAESVRAESGETAGAGDEVPPGAAHGAAPVENAAVEPVPPPQPTPEQHAPPALAYSALDFRTLASDGRLGGEALQRRRKHESDISVAMDELKLAENQLMWTEKLYEREFVPLSELERDRMSFRRTQIGLESAQTEERLFFTHEFPKQAEKALSDYEEAVRKFLRTRKQAVSKMAQANARLSSTRARFELQTRQLDELREQKEKCVIRAKRQGLVVYGGQTEIWYGSEPIAEGATVRERQSIITIPDMTQMAVKAKVHESAIKQVQPGQKARIRIEAFPDEKLEGEVLRIGVLPSSENRWMNPDLTLFDTTVGVSGTHAWLKPGMTAEVEILVDELSDALYVPLHAVREQGGQRVVYVAHAGVPERRLVTIGKFNDEFVQVVEGLSEGEEVYLRLPTEQEDAAPPAGPQPEAPVEELPGSIELAHES